MEMSNLDNNISASNTGSLSLVEIILVLIILNCIIILEDFYSSSRFILCFFKQIISHISFVFPAWKLYINKNVECAEDIETAGKLIMTLDEVKMTIDEELAMLEKDIDFDGMFEEVEPSLEEVKEAFGMFDENDDGFIDAIELRNVLSRLSFGEASEAECTSMIVAFDDNKDGRIDFYEFVKLLESSLS